MGDTDKSILIEVSVDENGKYSSRSHLTGVSEQVAGAILIDVGRDFLLRALAHHEHDHHHKE